MQRTSIPPIIGALALVAGACVYTPENGADFDVDELIRFNGLSSQPGATIELYGFDRSVGEWVEIAQTTAAMTPNEFHHNRRFYNWHLELRLDEYDRWGCLLTSDCEVDGEASYEVQLQVREVDGAIERLFTFDDGGFECFFERYRAGGDLFSAYWPCRADDYEQLRLQINL